MAQKLTRPCLKRDGNRSLFFVRARWKLVGWSTWKRAAVAAMVLVSFSAAAEEEQAPCTGGPAPDAVKLKEASLVTLPDAFAFCVSRNGAGDREQATALMRGVFQANLKALGDPFSDGGNGEWLCILFSGERPAIVPAPYSIRSFPSTLAVEAECEATESCINSCVTEFTSGLPAGVQPTGKVRMAFIGMSEKKIHAKLTVPVVKKPAAAPEPKK